MIVTNGIEISGKDCFGRREDLSFIVRFNWKTSDHLKEAIQVLLAARLAAACNDLPSVAEHSATGWGCRKRTDLLDEAEFERVRMQIASNPNTPPAVLEYLAKSATPRVLERIAENSRTPIELLEKLARSPLSNVRAAVADNSNTPEEILEVLVRDTDTDVRYRMAENPCMPVGMLAKLVLDENPYISARAAQTMTKIAAGTNGQVLHRNFSRRARLDEAQVVYL